MNFPNVVRVMAVAIYAITMWTRTNMSWPKERGQLRNEQETEGGSESALETGSSSAKSASETALTAGRELTTGDRIYIYISIYNAATRRHSANLQ